MWLWQVGRRWGAFFGAVIVGTRLGCGELDRGRTRVARALQLVELPVEIGPESVTIDDAAVLSLQLLAVEADKEGADIVEELVYPREVDQTLIYGL